MRTSFIVVAAALAATAGVALAQDSAWNPGNLVISQIGLDGSSTSLSGAATAAVLKEFQIGAGFTGDNVQLPSALESRRLTSSGSATSEGMLTRSADGLYLTYQGYDAAAGTASIAGTSTTSVARTVAKVDWQLSADLSTTTTSFTAGNIRSSLLIGDTVYMAGSGSSGSGGVRSIADGGSGAATIESGALTNARVVNTFGGNVYASAASGAFIGISLISGGTATLLPGFGSTVSPSAYDFVFADSSTLYVADDSGNTNGGIQKWTFDGSTWSRQYVLRSTDLGGTFAARGLTLGTDGSGNNVLYAITAEASGNRLIAVTDTGSGSLATVLATAGPNTIFRGVEFAPIPTPGSIALLGLGGLIAARRRRA